MKRCLLFLILTALLLGMTGCAFRLDDDYLSVEPHVEPSSALPSTEEAEPVIVANRDELRGTVLSFIRNWVEHDTILVRDYSGDISADLTETMHYATKEDPVGAYAVDFADAQLEGDGKDGSIEISIVFRRSAAEIAAIETVSGNAGAYEKIRLALINSDSALTLRIRNYQDAEFAEYIRKYCVEHPQTVLAIPEISASIYPQEGETRILELHFAYAHTRDELRSMLDSVNTILNSASSYIRHAQDDLERVQLLFRFLTERIDYTVAETEPTMPAYSLLKERMAHSLSFASVFYLECSKADIPCSIVYGTRGEQSHYWNVLEIDEQEYCVDLMRAVEKGETELFLLTREQLESEGYLWPEGQ